MTYPPQCGSVVLGSSSTITHVVEDGQVKTSIEPMGQWLGGTPGQEQSHGSAGQQTGPYWLGGADRGGGLSTPLGAEGSRRLNGMELGAATAHNLTHFVRNEKEMMT